MSAPANASANATLSGAREGRASWPRRLVARASARDLRAFVVPGPEVARAGGLDLEAAGLRIMDTPRHAGVLVLVGEPPAVLKRAAAVAYAQMPRPRAILGVGAGDVAPLPKPDASGGMGQEALEEAVAALRRSFADGAFSPEAPGFDADEIRTQTEYVCPMHPEVVSDEPGSCPKCGMDLVPREAAGGTDHDHVDHSGHDRADHGGMDHGQEEHGQAGQEHPGHEHAGHGITDHPGHGGQDDADREVMDHGGSGDHGGGGTAHEEPGAGYTDHGEEGSEGHELNGGAEHGGHGGHGGMDHGGHGGHDHMDHGDMGFMSMVEMTKDLPRGSDGLQMERVEAPFGPLFPGLPGGLSLKLELDGDTVAGAEAHGVRAGTLEYLAGPAGTFVGRLRGLDPLSPVAYRLLAVRAVEDAAGITADEETALARAGALERERAASHLNWLAVFAHLLGYAWLEGRAVRLHLALMRAADAGEAARLRGEVSKLARGVGRTPLLRRKLRGIGRLPAGTEALGPVARSRGMRTDARLGDEVYGRVLGFEPVVREGDDALSRLLARLEEAERSLELVGRAGSASLPDPDGPLDVLHRNGGPDGVGSATVETPRGAATLHVTLEGGEVTGFGLETPSARHLGLVEAVTEGQELADALVGVASLDLSPWGVDR